MENVVIAPAAANALRRMQPKRAAAIMARIQAYAADPAAPAHQVKRLQGRDGYRMRVGDFRVLFRHDGGTVTVLDIGPRGDIYK